jgi:replicative DNA helicase
LNSAFRYDTFFQVRILAVAIAREENLRNLLGIIQPEYFTSALLATAWKLLAKYYTNEGVKVSPDTLAMLLKTLLEVRTKKPLGFTAEQVDELREQLINTDLSDADIVLKEVQNFCKQAAFLSVMSAQVDKVLQGEYDELYLKMQELFSQDFTQAYLGLDYFKEVSKRYLGGRSSARQNVIPTGLELDNHWGGGLGAKELGLVLAPTGRGKTAMMLNMAYNALAQGRHVTYVSCELSEEELGSRMDKLLMSMVRNMEQFLPADVVMTVKKFGASSKSRLIIREFPSRELTVPKLQSYIKTLEATKKHKTDILFVDYLGDMRLPSAEREDLAYRQLASELRALAHKLEIPIWTAHQMNRGSHEKSLLDLGDVSDSFALTYVMDVAFTMSAHPIEFAAGYQRLTIVKNRFGPTGETFPVRFNGASQRFSKADTVELNDAFKRKALELSKTMPTEVGLTGGIRD